MSSWAEFTAQAPELAAAVLARFEAGKHHVLATLRADGSPRVSGTEAHVRHGELYIGSMPGARKAADLQRDPRFALHAHTGDGSMTGGDAKVAGRAVASTDERFEVTPPAHLFLLDLTEVVLTTVQDDRLVVQLWRPGRGVTRTERA
ncbi:MAG: pyridoxamine 5-phosphate oxidase [Frankiales bacterium]|jgi:hypothetical protein|nr:pyridoxamine 5-phosphate oxidase [Frankiales bacterium]